MKGFLGVMPRFAAWNLERVAIATRLTPEQRESITRAGFIPQELVDLTSGL